jgi:uncharacterized protein YfaS (alpha-2-macroglobulin family)
VDDFVTAYATNFLIEMRDHDLEVPNMLLDRALASLRTIVATPGDTMRELRAQTYALYLLTRSGFLVTGQLESVREALDRVEPNDWHSDSAALYMAAAYQLLKMDQQAAELLRHAPSATPVAPDYDGYYDDLVYRSTYVYLMAKHFPDRAKKIGGDQILTLADSITAGNVDTISAASAIIALDAYANIAGAQAGAPPAFSEILDDQSSRRLIASGDLYPHVAVSPDAKSVHVEGDTPFALFYQLTEEGYDLEPPAREIRNRIEVFREYRNEQHEGTNSATLDSTIDVYISLRAIDNPVANVAITDMIPGGFEVDISPAGLGSRNSLVQDSATWHLDYIDVREDRVIFYGAVDSHARTFVYRLKPTNPGSFAVAPLYAEGMYDRSVSARSLAGRFTIREAQPIAKKH